MRIPNYRVLIREPGTNFSPGNLVAEFENHKNLGWGEYLNDVGEAFCTIAQADSKLDFIDNDLLRAGLHMEVFRNTDKVFGGWIGEVDETEADVIFHSYSYVAALFWLHSEWNHKWTGEQINTIVSNLWTRARTGLSDSALRWVTTGTIQAPVTETGGSTAIVLPMYQINWKRILFAMQELAGMAASDTDNRVVFEITPTGTFNFWKNLGTTRDDRAFQYGGNVLGYHRVRTPMDRRNYIRSVGSSPRDIVLRKTTFFPAQIAQDSRREETLFYSWIRDEEEMVRVNNLRLKRAMRIDNMIALSMAPGSITPARATDADYALGDLIPVRLTNGLTKLDAPKLVTGQQVVLNRGVELVRPIVQDSI